jgi:SAM-dependent methyltransferase
MDIDRIYAEHPLNKRTILARLASQGAQSPFHEWHLAIDPETELTDQNHSGGVQSVLELAAAAGLTREMVVADVGAGLGGSARVLAAALGCRVVGVERDAGRCTDAIDLTRLVGLEERVAMVNADALEGPLPAQDIDVLWGQDAWIHFPDPRRFLARWVPALRRTGKIAIADAYLLRSPGSDEEIRLIQQLEESWAGCLTTVDRWDHALHETGFAFAHREPRTEDAVAGVKKLLRISARWPEGTVTPFEIAGWSRALEAYERGIVGSFRLVAERCG